MRCINLAWFYADDTLHMAVVNKASSEYFWLGIHDLLHCFTLSTWYKLVVSEPKDSLPRFPSCYLSYTMNQ